jgi:hypothetical protein
MHNNVHDALKLFLLQLLPMNIPSPKTGFGIPERNMPLLAHTALIHTTGKLCSNYFKHTLSLQLVYQWSSLLPGSQRKSPTFHC